MDLHIRQYLTKAQRHKDVDALRAAYDMIGKGTADQPASDRCFGPELYVLCAEQAYQLGCEEMSRDCLMMYFEGKPPTNQFRCRAYLCQGQLNSPQTVWSVEDVETSVISFLKAIEISKDKPRYHFLVFNASVLYFQTVRPLLRPGQRRRLAPSLAQVLRALEEVDDPDHAWRARLMLHLVECLVDAGKVKEACSFSKATSDFIEAHTPELYPQICSLQVQHKLFDFSKNPKKIEGSPTLSVIYKMQKLKHKVELSEPRKEDAARLKEIFHLLTPPQPPVAPPQPPAPVPGGSPRPAESPSPISPAERASFLLELALLALQLKQPQTAADCLRELRTTADPSAGQCIMMECVQCELDLQKQEGKMTDYSKANGEARLKVIGRLDRCLQSAVREGDAGVTQAACAAQWNACLPLLQRNLRRRVKGALLRVAQVLEDIHSVLLETRCQVHAELAQAEEEEGRLGAAAAHLEKALRLDERGAHRERLAAALRLLRLRGTLYDAPARAEDRAAMLIQQAKDGQPQEEVRKLRPLLVNAGLALAPDAFQAVLDADGEAKVSAGGGGRAAQLCAKAQHHSACVLKVDGHLARQAGGDSDRERVKLWAALAKTARKQEVWDVCRAACRFGLLYDDGRWKIPKAECERKVDDSPVEGLHGDRRPLPGRQAQSPERDSLRLLVELHFINAEATVLKLRTEGLQLNAPAVPPEERGAVLSDEDPQWAVYRDWTRGLSAHATSGFLRAAAMGAELREAWAAVNAAVYLWNYNARLLASGERRRLLGPFQRLVELLKETGHAGEPALLVLLCDAVARGMVQPWCVSTAGGGSQEGRGSLGSVGRGGPGATLPLPGDSRARKGPGKGPPERTASVHAVPLDAAALQDVRKALELCDYALRLSNGNVPGESVPLAARKQVVATWVRSKRLLQQQIGQKLDVDDECKSESVSAVTRVLVAVEMLLCNRHPRQMEFSVPALSVLVRMASDCPWSDPVVELEVWSQLASFSHQAHDHSLVMTCTHNALQLERAAAQRLKVLPCALYSPAAVQGLLSAVACLRGLTMGHESSGHPLRYREALSVLQSSVSYAERAGNPALCMVAARHYWNASLPLMETPWERQHLRDPLQSILSALAHTGTKDPTKRGGGERTDRTADPSQLEASGTAGPEEDLALRAAMYGLLFHIHADRADWRAALRALEQGIAELPRTGSRLLLFKQRVLVHARLGESVLMDMQRFRDQGELCCSHMWHRGALCARDLPQQLACYQNAITALLAVESQWQKVDYLLEFAEWLYCHDFPLADAQHQVQWAVDILLHSEMNQGEETDRPVSKGAKLKELERKEDSQGPSEAAGPIPVQCESLVGVQGVRRAPRLSDLREVHRLDGLVRAHTLLAVLTGRTAPEHQQHLLTAYCCVLRIWQVSVATAGEVLAAEVQKSPCFPPSQPSVTSTARKDKDKDKGRKSRDVQPPPAEEKPKAGPRDDPLPRTPAEWAQFDCPADLRRTFRDHSSPHSINTTSISHQTRSLFFLDLLAKELRSLSLAHLTLPIMHLAEVIAHDLLGRRSLSDLYRLRIVRACCQLGAERSSPYHENLLGLTGVHEHERTECRRAMALQRERSGPHEEARGNMEDQTSGREEEEHAGVFGSGWTPRCAGVCAQSVWLDQAEACQSVGLYQPARQLLVEAQLVCEELGDRACEARCLCALAVLANAERDHGRALALLERARGLGGDEEFWFRLTLARVDATVGLKNPDADVKVDQVVQQGCHALNLVLEQRQNRAPYLRFLIASLESRAASERWRGARPAEPGEALPARAAQKMAAAADTLREAAAAFLQLGRRQHAAEALLEHAEALRVLAEHAGDREAKRRHLLDALSLTQRAVSTQEHVALNAQSLGSSQECGPLALPAVRRLLALRLVLAEQGVAMLEQVCVDEQSRRLAQDTKASVERMLEELVRSTPDPGSVEQEWACVGSTLGQVALSQLAVVTGLSPPDCVETRARVLGLTGRCLRLLAMQKDPLYPSALWDGHSQLNPAQGEVGVRSEEASPVGLRNEGEEEDEEEEEDLSGGESRGSAPRPSCAAKRAELQGRRRAAQQLLAQASETLAQAVGLCLQHRLPARVLSQACQDMLECHGQLDPSATGQYMALLQSCSCVSTLTGVLSSACSDPGASQLAALLNLRRKLLSAREETPGGLLRGAEDALDGLPLKVYGHLSINPSHLSLLGELPSNLKILLLQHSEDRSVLYGAVYERSKPAESQRGKSAHASAGTLVCTQVSKAVVRPGALLALRDEARAFRRETRQAFLKEARRHGNQGRLGATLRPRAPAKSDWEEKLERYFKDLVLHMEDYLRPVLSQFDFSCFRLQTPLISIPEAGRPREKDEKTAPDKAGSPAGLGEGVVLLADGTLMELPLEALAVLQDEGLSSVSRDFSLQLLRARLQRQEPVSATVSRNNPRVGDVESETKRETKGGKASKAKGDQSKAIKVVPLNRVLPPNTLPLDTHSFKYIVDPYNEGEFEGTSLTERMRRTLEVHGQQLTPLWEGFLGSERTPGLAEVEQLLTTSGAFIFHGTERFLANVPPAKMAALNLSECQMAILSDLAQNSASMLRQSRLDVDKSEGQLALESPLDTAMLLSLCGVRCVTLNQWHSSLQRNARDMDAILDNFLRVGLTSGQTIHALRKREAQSSNREGNASASSDSALCGGSDPRRAGTPEEPRPRGPPLLSAFNRVIYGLPNLVVT